MSARVRAAVLSGSPSRQMVGTASVFGVRVDDHAGPRAEPATPTRDEEMHGVGDLVAEAEQRERALMGEHRRARSHRHPRLAHVVVLIAREPMHAIQAAAHPLEAATAHVMLDQLAARAMRAGLRSGPLEIPVVEPN
jgi:hypothetical protein